MAVQKRSPPGLRLRRWPTADWHDAPLGYRFIKTTFQLPVTWAARLSARGAQHVPSEGGVLLAANHLSWADPVVVGAAIHRPAYYLAKEGVFRNPLAAKFFESMGQIKVDRQTGGNEPAISTALRLLDEGYVVGIFPEGTRSRPGQVKRGKTGIARIAAISGAPIVPIGCDTGAFWPKASRLPRWGQKVYVNVGEPLRLGLKPDDAHDRERMREATDLVMARVRELYEEAVKARLEGTKWD